MPKGRPVNSVKRRLLAATGGKQRLMNPHRHYPDRYYKSIYFNKQKFDGIEVVAKCENMSRMDAADLLIEKGLSRWQGDKLLEWHNLQKEARDNGLPAPNPITGGCKLDRSGG